MLLSGKPRFLRHELADLESDSRATNMIPTEHGLRAIYLAVGHQGAGFAMERI